MQAFQIYLIEDCDTDFVAFRRAVSWAMQQLGAQAEIRRYNSAAVAYAALQAGAQPDLLFVDLNLQGEGGLAFLRRVKEDPRIVPCPKIILTTSSNETDVRQSFGEGAAGYLVKPLVHSELREAVRVCLQYWLVASRRPKPHPSFAGAAPPRC